MGLRDELTDQITALPGVEQRKSRFSKRPAFVVGRREVAHFHSVNEIDIRLTRARIRALDDDDARVRKRGSSEWVEFGFRRRADLTRALELVAAEVEANC